jgi:hypothetical protein
MPRNMPTSRESSKNLRVIISAGRTRFSSRIPDSQIEADGCKLICKSAPAKLPQVILDLGQGQHPFPHQICFKSLVHGGYTIDGALMTSSYVAVRAATQPCQ